MADKNKQWEELDYSDENQDDFEEEAEYAENYSNENGGYEEDEESYEAPDDEEYDEDDSYEEEDDDDEEEDGANGGNNTVKIMLILLLLLLILGGGAYLVTKSGLLGGQNLASEQTAAQQNQNQNQMIPNSSAGEDNGFFENTGGEGDDFIDVSFNENGDTNINDNQGSGDTITVSDAPQDNTENDMFINDALEQNQSDDSIMVSYNNAVRPNPFKPPVITSSANQESPYAVVDDVPFEIIEPPAASVPDETLTRLLQTQISGILYDPESPSAIINLNGTDYFVKIGDKISGYLIKNITRDKVQVNYKNNTYVASVGQLFTKGVLEQQHIADFEHKFAGRRNNNNNNNNDSN